MLHQCWNEELLDVSLPRLPLASIAHCRTAWSWADRKRIGRAFHTSPAAWHLHGRVPCRRCLDRYLPDPRSRDQWQRRQQCASHVRVSWKTASSWTAPMWWRNVRTDPCPLCQDAPHSPARAPSPHPAHVASGGWRESAPAWTDCTQCQGSSTCCKKNKVNPHE